MKKTRREKKWDKMQSKVSLDLKYLIQTEEEKAWLMQNYEKIAEISPKIATANATIIPPKKTPSFAQMLNESAEFTKLIGLKCKEDDFDFLKTYPNVSQHIPILPNDPKGFQL